MHCNTTTSKQPTRILFTHYGDEWIRGSERCLLDLLLHLDRKKYDPIVWCNSRVMADCVTAYGITVYLDKFPLLCGWKAPYFDLIALIKLIKKGIQLIDKHNIKILHANSGAPNQWLNFISRARRIPLIAHLHSHYQLRDRISLGLHHIPMVVGVSKSAIDSITGNQRRVIANGIDCNHLDKQPNVELRKQLGIDSNDFLIATTGSLIKRKGIDLIIDAVKQLRQKKLPVYLVVIGEGEQRNNIEQQIKRLNLGKVVFLLGEQHNVIGLLRNNVDVFVSAAREEVFGLVLAEAGLAGLPVIAPNIDGIPTVVKDGVTGLLVAPENSHAISKAIRTLFNNPQLRMQLGNAGRKHVLENFTIERNVNEFERLYRFLLHAPSMQTNWVRHWNYRKAIVECVRHVFNTLRNYRFTHVS